MAKKNTAPKPPDQAKHKTVPLPADALRWRCPPENLPFETTADIEPATSMVGQDTAVDALRFGLEINAPGQNIFVRGLVGTGRMTLVRRLMDEIRLACPQTQDRCYVRNFTQPDRPRLITLPRGRGREFQRYLDQLIRFVRDNLGDALASDPVRLESVQIDREAEQEVNSIVTPFETALRDAGLTLVSVHLGPMVQSTLAPVIDGKPLPPEEFEQLRASGKITDEQVAAIRAQQERFRQGLEQITAQVNEIRRRHTTKMRAVREKAARSVIGAITGGIESEFTGADVHLFLAELVDDVVAYGLAGFPEDLDLDRRYGVNVVLSHDEADSCSVVMENTPTVTKLLGSIDRSFGPRDVVFSDHMMIRPGSLLRADGGFLILEAREVLREPGAWRALVRTLKTGLLEMVPPEMSLPWFGPSLKPEPIDLNIKVILIGSEDTYYLLDSYDPDFPFLFKVLADFDYFIDRDPDGIRRYGEVLTRIIRDEKLLDFDRNAVAAIVEHGARVASRKGKLTSRFGRLADIAREAVFICGKQGEKTVTATNVHDAVARTKRRADLPSRRFREFLADGTISVQTAGKVVGQVNGLAVLQAGPLVYGFPARITATIGPGTSGVVNIEGESALSGAIHTKGFHILRGLLRHLLKTMHPLAFHASVAFEQTYGMIDGDSASGAEVCCLLSALTDVPLRQDFAFTGAIDQLGHILPIGAVNEKIEGFYDTCHDIGLTGTQGVLIPRANAGDLMLRQDVFDACRAGKFRVHAVATVLEALELLTDVPVGVPNDEGEYPEGSLMATAHERAFEFWLKAAPNAEAFFESQEGAEQEGQT